MTRCVVLREKLRVPEIAGLGRQRLEKPLLAGPPTLVDMVVAPAGCGKTTLLARIAAASSGPVGWYRVTAEDFSENRLVAHLAEALSAVVTIDRAASVAELLEALEQWDGSIGLLILDDLHEIADSPAEKALEKFISLRPHRLQLICGSRRMPEVNVPRIRVSGSIREIGGDDLRFRSWEVEELFASVFHEPLRPEAAAALTRRTGGWAAGLQLFHLATAGRSESERHRAVDDLGGRSKLVRSYLTRNVLAELPADRHEFLVRSCTLGRLSGKACDNLLGRSDSHRILEQLENDQLFTFTDDGGRYFRYHEVLQTHLELALVEEYGPAEARRCYRTSAAVLEALGELRSAARAYAKAGDWASVSRLVQSTGGARIDATAVDDAHILPASTWQHDPWLALANARRLVREGALRRAAEAYQQARALYDEPSYQQMCDHEAQVLSMWSPGYRPARSAQAVQDQHWSSVLREAVRVAPDFAELSWSAPNDARVRLMHGLAALSTGEISWARTILTDLTGDESGDSPVAISACLALVVLDLLDGADIDSAATLSAIAIRAESEGLPWISRLCQGLEQIALIGSGGAAWRLQSCSDLVRVADRVGDAWGGGLLVVMVGLVKQRAGQQSAAEMSDAADRFSVLGAPVLELWCRLLAMREGVVAADAHRAVTASRAMRARGLEAVALSMVAVAAPDDGSAAREAEKLAQQCGLRVDLGAKPSSGCAVTATVAVTETSVPAVAVTCFGEYSVAVDGHPATPASLRPQARRVLQLLSLSPDRDHHREFLEDILWPGTEHSVACHRLQVAVSSVRSSFGAGEVVIARRGESYRLCLPPKSTVDVQDFDTLLARAAAMSARGDLHGRIAARREALQLYRGELLPELIGCTHVDTERDRLRCRAASAAADLASDYRALGDNEQALVSAQRSVQLDPYQDAGWLILVDVCESLGDISSAEYVRREYARARAELQPPAR